ncbi:MAG: nucleotide exchange factor GrpE [Candidatus Gracilibacteria bacterium]|jgi:molecular chaperone GrpE|nr:nucleotide exchange factor GrpE [Candidatus Gracilibacteria bacterium]MDD5179396.1 nucleotide exchange factor GrpE [Candidatus Gracilibacteria bacterium]
MSEDNQIPGNPPAEEDTALEEAQLKIAELENNWKRCAAELENYRKQVERERLDFAQYANAKALIALLPVLDNFQRANAHLPAELEKNEWVKGIAGVEAQLEETLTSLGLQKIPVKAGDSLDPNKHEAIAMGEGESGKIIDILEDGYELHGKILRAAKVRVGK